MRVPAPQAPLWIALCLASALAAGACGHASGSRGTIPTVSGDADTQLAAARTSLAHGRGDAETWASAAAALLERGDLGGAGAAARRGLALAPEHAGLTVVAARAEARAGDPAAALALYARAAEVAPALAGSVARERAEVALRVAEAAAQRGEADAAAAALSALEASGPDVAEGYRDRRGAAWLAVAAGHLEQGVAEPAAHALARARAAQADAGELAFAEASLLDLRADPRATEQLAAWASRLDRGARWVRVGALHERRGRPAEAEAAYRRAAEADPEAPAPWDALAALALRSAKADDARTAWREAAARRRAAGDLSGALVGLQRAAARLSRAQRLGPAADLLVEAAVLAPAPCPPAGGLALAESCAWLALDDALDALAEAGRAPEGAPLAVGWIRAAGPDEAPARAVLAAGALTRRGAPELALAALGALPPSAAPEVALARLEALVGLVADPQALLRAHAAGVALPAGDVGAAARAASDALEPQLMPAEGGGEAAGVVRLARARLGLRDLAGAARATSWLAAHHASSPWADLLAVLTSLAQRRAPGDAFAALEARLPRAAEAPEVALIVARALMDAGLLDRARPWLEAATASADAAVRREAHGALADPGLHQTGTLAVFGPAMGSDAAPDPAVATPGAGPVPAAGAAAGAAAPRRAAPAQRVGSGPRPERALEHLRVWLALLPAPARLRALPRKAAAWSRRSAPPALALALDAERLADLPEDEALQEAHLAALIAARRWDEVLPAAERWLAHALRPSVVATQLGERLRRDGQAALAAALLARAAPEQATDPLLHPVLARFFAGRGEDSRARRHAEAFIALGLEHRAIGPVRLLAFSTELLARGDLDLAVRAAERVSAANGDSAQAAQVLGRALLRRGDDAAAARVFDAYIDAGARTARKRLEEVARVYTEEGRLAAAAAVLERRLQLDAAPNLAIFNELAAVLRLRGDVPTLDRVARETVARAGIAAGQRFAEAAATRLSEGGALDAAAALLRDAIGQSPRDRRLLAAAFDTAVSRRDGAEALALGVRIGTTVADEGKTWVERARALSRGGLPREAAALLDRAIEATPGLAALHLQRALGRLDLGDIVGAQADFVEALTLSTAPREVLSAAEPALRDAHAEGLWRDLLARAHGAAPGRSEHLLALAESLLRSGRDVEARQALLRHFAETDRGELAAARAFAAVGAEGEAVTRALRAFEQVTPAEAQALLGEVAAALERLGAPERLDEAVRLYLLAARGGADRPDLVAVAQAFRAVGRPDDALRWFARADELAPSAELSFVLGGLYDAAGDEAAALGSYARYVARAAGERPAHRAGDPLPAAVGRVLERLLAVGRPDAARTFITQVARTHGASAWTGLMVARVHARSGDCARAVAAVEEVTLPSWAEDRVALAQVRALLDDLLAQGALEEADVVLARALAAGWNVALGFAGVRIAARRGEPVAVARAAEALLAEHGPAVWADLGAALAEEGYQREAVALWRSALATPQAPRPLDAALGLARLGHPLPSPGAVERDVVERAALHATVALSRADTAAAAAAALGAEAFTVAGGEAAVWKLGLRVAAEREDAAAVGQLLDQLARRPGDVRQGLGEAQARLRLMGAPRLALVAQDRLVALRLGSAPTRLDGVELALAGGLSEVARARAEALLGLSGPDPAALRVELAERFAAWHAPEPAREHLDAAGALTGALAWRAGLVRARLAALGGDGAAAAEACAAARAGRDEVPARVACADVLARAGARPATVLAELAPVLAGEAPPRVALVLAAEAAWGAGDPPRARAALARLLARHPSWAEPMERLLGAAVRAGDLEGAQRLRAQGLRAGTLTSTRAAVVAAGALSSTPPPDVVAWVRDRAVEAEADAGPADPRGSWAWAALALSEGGREAALSAVTAAAAGRPRSREAAHAVARALLAEPVQGAPARALTWVDEALRRPPTEPRLADERRSPGLTDTAHLLDTRAWALHHLGRHREALADVLRARASAPSEGREPGEWLQQHAEILLAAGRREEAVAAFQACARAAAEPWAAACRERLRPHAGP